MMTDWKHYLVDKPLLGYSLCSPVTLIYMTEELPGLAGTHISISHAQPLYHSHHHH